MLWPNQVSGYIDLYPRPTTLPTTSPTYGESFFIQDILIARTTGYIHLFISEYFGKIWQLTLTTTNEGVINR